MKKFITAEDIRKYANVSKDTAAIHINPDTAMDAGFERPIVHGMYLMGLAQSFYLKAHPNQWIMQYEMLFKQAILVDQEARFQFEKQGNLVQVTISSREQEVIALGTFNVKEWYQ